MDVWWIFDDFSSTIRSFLSPMFYGHGASHGAEIAKIWGDKRLDVEAGPVQVMGVSGGGETFAVFEKL